MSGNNKKNKRQWASELHIFLQASQQDLEWRDVTYTVGLERQGQLPKGHTFLCTTVYTWLDSPQEVEFVVELLGQYSVALSYWRTGRFPQTEQLGLHFAQWKTEAWTDEFVPPFKEMAQDYDLETCYILQEASGTASAHSVWNTPQVLNMPRKWRALNHPPFSVKMCVLCLPVVSTPSMTINTKCAFYSTFRSRKMQHVNVKSCFFCHVYPY